MFSFLGLLLFISSYSLGQGGVEKALRKLRDSIDRFEANFHRATDDYGRSGLVRKALEELANQKFRLEDQISLNFPEAVVEIEVRLQKFFDSKTVALRNLVSTAEKVANQINLPDLDWPDLSDHECAQHLQQLNKNSVKNETIWKGQGRDRSKSGVHIATESYRCSGPVVRDFKWTVQEQLNEQMVKNTQQDGDIMRQYIGTYSGLTRIFPGFQWDIGSEQYSIDLFDPRMRPWFVTAETSPRDVLFLMDFSGSAKGLNAHLIKTSVLSVLQTLTPNDFFSGIWYNSRQQKVLANCTDPNDSFIQATTRNKLLFRRFLDRTEEKDQASLPAALEMSFAEFIQRENITTNARGQIPPNKRSGGHRLILLFTDGIEFWPTEVVERFQQEYPNEPIRVFGYSMGFGRGPQDALAWLTCQTKAGPAQAVIGSVAEVRLKARKYLEKLNEILALTYRDKASNPENRPISWPNPYMDVQKGGPLLTLSMPILGPQPAIYKDMDSTTSRRMEKNESVKLDGFLGVAGIDISFSALGKVLQFSAEPNHEHVYAFLVDNNGLVYYHPKLQTPRTDTFAVRHTLCHRLSTFLRTNTRVPFSRADELVLQQMGYLDSIAQMDILQLENEGDELMQKFRTNLVLGRCGQVLEDDRRELRCFAIRGTPLVAGFVLKKEKSKITLQGLQENEEDPYELAERLRNALTYLDEESDAEPPDQQNNTMPIPPSVGILIRDNQLQQSSISSELSRVKTFHRFNKLLQLLPNMNSQYLAHLSSLAPDSLFNIWASKWPKDGRGASPSCNSRPPFVSAFLELSSSALVGQPGILAIFPRCKLATIKSFLSIPNGGKETTKLTVNVDPEKDGLITVEQPLGILDGRKPLARVGVQFRGTYLQQKLLRALQQPVDGWAECIGPGRKCLLVNADSFVLATSAINNQQSAMEFRPSHLSRHEPELFDELNARGFIQKINWRDPTGICPMVMELRQRQQHFPVTYYMQQSQSSLPEQHQYSSAQSASSTIGHFLNLLFSWTDFIFPFPVNAAFPSNPDKIMHLEDLDDCEIEPQPDLVEHCTLERTFYRLKIRSNKERKGDQQQKQGKTATALWLREKNCANRTVGILPFEQSELYLILLDGQCENNNSPTPPSNSFISYVQVPNCNLTMESLTLQRRLRTDLEYSRSHPKEFNHVCTNAAFIRNSASNYLTIPLIIFTALFFI